MMQKHSVVIAGHETSFSLESDFWEELKGLARQQNISLTTLITEIDRGRDGNLSSAIRLYILTRLRQEIIQNKTTQSDAVNGKDDK